MPLVVLVESLAKELWDYYYVHTHGAQEQYKIYRPTKKENRKIDKQRKIKYL
ncbi:hypothetical protein HanXRQr2_Chr15g0701131 [Helianthus annuus]|uniref:Uncharacterized protein n=1 Tax=Helianthus annuus TaxID=4232 RepID=A0A9K3E369_HELAN|nr:hypothetical protein HanXRQr2_Chr15g0701131 [Helianthus annuus]KAJ0831925.1 hypothetical protein HanPSC8_Chr15g0672801 [Helianthus annuus]